MPGPVQAIGYSPDGSVLGIGSVGGEVRLFNAADGKRRTVLKGHEGAIFALAFHPSTNWVLTAGYEGKVRVFDTMKGELLRSFYPVPIQGAAGGGVRPAQQAAR